MSLKIGIVGLPNVGKSTLFKALTKKQVDTANYPFVTIEPNIGVVPVPDARVDTLASLSHSKKIIHAVVEFVDIAGLVKGAAEGEGLGNKFLTNIKEVDAITEVVRVFEDPNIIHVHNTIDPPEDIRIIHLELILKDLETLDRRLEGIEKQVRAGEKSAPTQKDLMVRLKENLEKGLMADEVLAEISKEELEKKEIQIILNELQLLTAKRRIFVFNASEAQITSHWQPDTALKTALKGALYVVLSASIEDELNSLAPEEKKEYLKTLGLAESGLDALIETGYKTLNLMTFLTTGEDETRAWTIPAGSTGPRAGRAIHSDFEEKFIRTEVIPFEKLVEAGSYAKARELGWVKTEGKEYVVRDGDVVEFKI
ncbi:MAG: redox-regulated ATPase YchF [Candidatus Sungbacteria bacterium RIFCSPLOWO2_02_FULL_47_9]|uniref:Ribosome-binding ATPase YchF n=1 Tax=Candidatus Sungbacteria bacterium RIFCSPHIGHO2_01_FULL_47_32 TaxID=1802264 RepID=A0A1G2K8K9_9BACT|nr:MAG: GTP-binding protein YchF [Parcubacteria group bacterium GW2011_GWA2_47_10]OGZ95757.1 MAG: redox-regulated ATPase YchF [Candidatus Sungbacteria bacterium RIFCSPHIGHO2_01_FULL_47_32]OGZ99073.1 MAG: redox-regulated ATPase YchF [Candidatus Sungbacteria bacterium RIFCSPHIGHO2_02_FULL_46_12]OHA04564.1 MAG: redox-regulated ATPase YchF [Candidatus Sungbacteria bacterium RIFCSPLOWO2_01_FULL_47_32]OHA09607.1 MAG: redox-regulated ATPase YchF [Candidatus Sungbacteria bacterium RIFCSPLOWO2_02_FULL_4